MLAHLRHAASLISAAGMLAAPGALLLGSLAQAMPPQAPDSLSAQDAAVVRYHVDLREPQTQKLRVTLSVPSSGAAHEEFCLPAWRPGR